MKLKKPILWTLALLLTAAVAGYSLLQESDRSRLLPFESDSIVDFHVHVAGLGYGGSGCFINAGMRENFRFKIYLKAMGVSLEDLQQHGDGILAERLSKAIADSGVVGKAVVLALDGVIDRRGELDREASQLFVPNTFVHRLSVRHENLLFGASINPHRPNALALLEQVKSQGAVLIKWIPSIMNIDPADPAFEPFYRKMAELKLPLLSHTGLEKSFPNAVDALSDPKRLRLPLELGVTVIAAHMASTGFSEGQENFERAVEMLDAYPNLYADISSLTQINKLGYLNRTIALRRFQDRLIYGSDWPLQFFPLVSPWYQADSISLADAKAISGIDNLWDRDVALKYAMGLNRKVFHQGRQLLLGETQ